ncbi:MAG: 4-hydroxy-3-methylbut-2-enyl diphosphate reductase [Bacteroidetes bacterium]|nr:4-hydroxy-3-methylbut-2-enyl diphosphate reductase [Bacteroidota bacterium]
MTVSIDNSSGFCWGVVRTIDIAEKQISSGEKLYSLGEIIHNPAEIERLGKEGLVTVSRGDLEKLRGAKVLIRAHGEPPEIHERAKELGINIVDATCPVVAKVQERIRKFYNEGYQVVIFGKKEHAEVIGLVGQTNGEAIVVKTIDELKNVKFDRKTVLFSQTTMDKVAFHALKEELSKKIRELSAGSEVAVVEFQAKDTICGQVFRREKKIREFAAANEIIVFVAGKYSSNGKVLYNIVKSVNPKIFFIEDENELCREWFDGINTVGITGATSTPQWLMEKVKEKIESYNNKEENKIQPNIINEPITH